MIGSDEYAVYTAVCRTDLFKWNAPGLTFMDETVADRFTRTPLDYLCGLIRYRCLKHAELLEDFAAKNAQPWPLEKLFEVAGGYALWSERLASEPDRRGGYFGLSRVGFGNHANSALVYLMHYGGPLCASGTFLLFERREQRWKLKDHWMSWNS